VNIEASALTKTGLVIMTIWGLMFLSDVSRLALPDSGGTSEYLADKARDVMGMNDYKKEAVESSSLKRLGLTMAYKPGTLPQVVKVAAGSEAEKSGLKAGDKIKSIDRYGVTKEKELEEWVAEKTRPGMSFLIERNGQTVTGLQLGKVPVVEQPKAAAVPVVGLEVSDMFGMYPTGVHAPMTMNPYPGELAEKAGIKNGEWILAINGQSISTAAEYRTKTEGQGPLTFTVLNTSTTPRQTREVKIR
jgi:S1-C subfamily serine protease